MRKAFCTSDRITSVSMQLLTMRRVESCNRWFLSHGTRSLSFIFTIPVAGYDISRSHRHSNALCPRNLYLYTTLACCCYLLVLLPFGSAHSPTYYYAYRSRTDPLTDSTSCMVLGSGVLVWLWMLWFDLYVFKMLNQFELRVRQPL